MAVKIKLGDSARRHGEDERPRRPVQRSLLFRAGMALLALVLAGGLVCAAIFAFYYHRYQGIVDDRLSKGPLFSSTAQIYAGPREVRPGQRLTAEAIANDLRRAGYNGSPQLGTYQLHDDSIFIKPGPLSFHSTDGATITTAGGQVTGITAENGAALRGYELEPQVITSLSEDKNRTKRRLVTYDQIPRRMVQAVTAIEDRRFFDHGGIDYRRLLGAFRNDIFHRHRYLEGGSTLTMQLARGFFLTPERHLKRKLIEMVITLQLESRFTKQQIFAMYANQINLGQRGSFAVNGFGEAAQAYFGKDLKQLGTAECALLAGIIQSPNRLNPFRHPERAIERRNTVLRSMVETGALTPAEAERAQAEPLHLAPQNVDASEAPYFVDLVHDQLNARLGDTSAGGTLRIYTSLDPDLQKAAAAAVTAGMANVDALVRKQHKGTDPVTYPQVALVALDPHTGQVLALVGGRNYGQSQLNHATSKRPTGSIFKPFVYATAEAGAVSGQQLDASVDADGNPTGGGTFTALTQLSDVPTTFTYNSGRSTYSPRNYKGAYHGDVTAIYALAHSLNNATISLGQKVGFENVAALARSSGILSAKGTPAVSLGTYDATPLDMAGAYTVFANGGVHLNPWMLSSVRNDRGDVVADFTPEARQVMDPRAAYLTQSLLEGVMNFGYGYAVRQRGFTAPAAGKTGTSNDAWFAAYSSNLICVVWVGNDDYTDVKLQGAAAAAPIWAEFMNRAIKLPQYSDMKAFTPPDGVTSYRLDKETNLLADESCPNDYTAAFLDGTQPLNTCSRMSSDQRGLFQKLFGIGSSPGVAAPAAPAPPPPAIPGQTRQIRPIVIQPTSVAPGASPNPEAPEAQKRRSLLQKLFGGGARPKPQPQPQQ